MSVNTYFLVLTVLAMVFVIGCSNDTAVENPAPTNSLVSISAGGDGDEISVDDDSACISPNDPSQSDPGDHEDNSLCPGTPLVIWVHESDGAFDATYSFRICDNGSKKNCEEEVVLCEFTACGTEWRAYTTFSQTGTGFCPGTTPTLLTPGTLGSLTLQVFNESQVKIGSDSFLVTNNCATGD